MGFKNTFELITKDIQEIENLVSNFQKSSNLSAIELDLLLSKLRNVYDLILMIKSHELNNPSNTVPEPEEIPQIKEAIKEISTKSDDSTKEKTEDSNASIIEIEEEIEARISPEPEEIIDDKSDHVEEEPVEEDPVEEETVEEEPNSKQATAISDQSVDLKKEEKTKIVSDKFEKNGEYLNEKIGSQSDILSRKIQSGPIDSIASSIGINDKFYFARELFHGKADDFKKAVEILDKAANFNEAFNYISNHFSWDMNDEPVQNLLNLIRRKFISSNNE